MRGALPGRPIRVGEPMPWFSARTITGNAFELQVSAGRWIVLEALRAQAAQFHEDRLTLHVVLRKVPHDMAPLAALGTPAFSCLADADGAIADRCGGTACTVVFDPLLHCVANIPLDHPNGHAAMLRNEPISSARA